VNARQAWAQHLINAAPDAPRYGSPEWLALPESHPAKIAAVVVAAESWARDGDDLEERLRREVLALSRAYMQAEDAEYVATYQRGYAPDPNLPAQIEAEYWDWIRGEAA
jgi:hypothetical protein